MSGECQFPGCGNLARRTYCSECLQYVRREPRPPAIGPLTFVLVVLAVATILAAAVAVVLYGTGAVIP